MAKPAKSRDYKAEEARRNAKARELGFSSRAQMRRAQRHGFKPPRVGTSPRSRIKATPTAKVTPADLLRFSAKPPPTPGPGGMVTIGPAVKRRLVPIATIRRQNQQWSNAHSRVPTSHYDPDMSAKRARLYHAAYVDPDTKAYKIENDLDSLRDYLVDEMGFYDDVEFDERYSVDMAV